MGAARFAKAVGLAFVATWTLVVGLERCASATNDEDTDFSTQVCDAMMQGNSPSGMCQDGVAIYLQSLQADCAESAGFQATCAMEARASSGDSAFQSHTATYDAGKGEMAAAWVLDGSTVDLSRPLLVSFRYSSKTDVVANISREGAGAVLASQLNATESGSWCVSSSFELPEASSGQIKVSAPASSPDAVAFDALYVRYAQRQSVVDTTAGASASKGSGGAALVESTCSETDMDECEAESDDGECSCIETSRSRPEFAVLVALPLSVMCVMLLVQCICVRQWRRRKDELEARVGDVESCSSYSTASAPPSPTSGTPQTWLLRRLSSGGALNRSQEKAAGLEQVPEEANGGGEIARVQLACILANAEQREAFAVFVKSSYSPESLLFFESIETYEQSENARWREDEAQQILARFVAPGAPYRVYLSPEVQGRLLGARSFPRGLFADAKAEVYSHMQLHFLAPFLGQAPAPPIADDALLPVDLA